MVDRRVGSSLASFFVERVPVAGSRAVLGDAAARHARVRRLEAGDAVRLTDGAGAVALGELIRLDPRSGDVEVRTSEHVDRPARLSLVVPVADRDRMLWLAEKAGELAVTDWCPVLYARSRSVSPRGEGESFARKVRARMIGALQQSGGAWLPTLHGERTLDDVIPACQGARGFLLDAGGEPLPSFAPFDATAIAVGPEGGLESTELDQLLSSGWRSASLGGATLRFETAGVAAVAIVRATQAR
jgi:16S rRNA (uracil1498-N3)-methyltransferase